MNMPPEHRVVVVEPQISCRKHNVTCEIERNIRFDISGLETYCLAARDPRVYDAFVLAAAIQFCDATKARSSVAWRRRISLQIPVHDPCHWKHPDVTTNLYQALSALTGDIWNVEFVRRRKPARASYQPPLPISSQPDAVMPFSDGLDSCAVSGLLERDGLKLIRVRLGPQPRRCRARTGSPIQFLSVPYRVLYFGNRNVEPSARSRGFRFTLLCGIAAYLSNSSTICMPESGQGIVGPALVPVGPEQPDYRNHPMFTQWMEKLFLGLFDHVITFRYPRLMRTKGETIGEYLSHFPDSTDWVETRSCWQSARQVSVAGRRRQCGVCAACMLRRMSLHAAGVSERPDAYVCENLNAATLQDGIAAEFRNRTSQGAFSEYAIAGTLHLHHLASVLQSTMGLSNMECQVFRLSQALRCHADDTRARLKRMLRKHQEEWTNFLEHLGPESFVGKWVR